MQSPKNDYSNSIEPSFSAKTIVKPLNQQTVINKQQSPEPKYRKAAFFHSRDGSSMDKDKGAQSAIQEMISRGDAKLSRSVER